MHENKKDENGTAHHQYFRIADVMIESYEHALKRMCPHLNLHAKEFAPPIDNKRP